MMDTKDNKLPDDPIEVIKTALFWMEKVNEYWTPRHQDLTRMALCARDIREWLKKKDIE